MTGQVVTVETRIPSDVYKTLRAHGLQRDALAERSQQLLALRFYRDRVLSLGKAARLAGMRYWEFIEFLSDNQVPVIDLSEEELAAELASAEDLLRELPK